MHVFVSKKEKTIWEKITIPKNHWRAKILAINIYLELFHFDQRTEFWSIFEGIHKKT